MKKLLNTYELVISTVFHVNIFRLQLTMGN
jgi:hypothetical protein